MRAIDGGELQITVISGVFAPQALKEVGTVVTVVTVVVVAQRCRDGSGVRHKKGLEPLPVRGHIFKYFLFYLLASVSPAGTVSA
jgi:hypothetical protein